MVRTDSAPVPALSVTPPADQVPDPAVASIQVEPSAVTRIFSPEPKVPVNRPPTVRAPPTVMESVLELPVSQLPALNLATPPGAGGAGLTVSGPVVVVP